MPDLPEDNGLLSVLRDENIPPSTVDISELLDAGRRKVRSRRWIGGAAVTAVVVAAIPVLLTVITPASTPVAEPSPSRLRAPKSCAVETLPIPPGYTNSQVYSGDSSGRYLAGTAWKYGESPTPVIWDNGKAVTLKPPVASHFPLVNAHGVVAGGGRDGSWVYRDGSYTMLRQPEGKSFIPVAVNDRGQILGTAAQRDPVSGKYIDNALVWSLTGEIERIADRPIMARGIDEDGTVIGTSSNRFDPALIWPSGGGVTELPSLIGPGKVGPGSIRNGWVAGWIISTIDIANGGFEEVIWNLASGATVAIPAEVDTIKKVNAHGWAAVTLSGDSHGFRPGLLADGELIRLPEPKGLVSGESVMTVTISDDGPKIGGNIGHADAISVTAVRWLCK